MLFWEGWVDHLWVASKHSSLNDKHTTVKNSPSICLFLVDLQNVEIYLFIASGWDGINKPTYKSRKESSQRERHHKGITELGSVVNGSWPFLFLRTVDFKNKHMNIHHQLAVWWGSCFHSLTFLICPLKNEVTKLEECFSAFSHYQRPCLLLTRKPFRHFVSNHLPHHKMFIPLLYCLLYTYSCVYLHFPYKKYFSVPYDG